MSIRSDLRLDHFYIRTNDALFEALLPLKDLVGGGRHQVVKTTEATWEGLYLTAQNGSYFEILKESGDGIGLAVSAEQIQYRDAAKIRDEMPWYVWESGLMKFPDGQLWFEWLSPASRVDPPTFINAWIMKYFNCHRAERSGPKPAAAKIARFDELHFMVGTEKFADVVTSCEWLPGSQVFGRDQCELRIPARGGSELLIRFEKSSEPPCVLHEIKFTMRGDVQLEPQRLGDYELRQSGRVATLFRNVG